MAAVDVKDISSEMVGSGGKGKRKAGNKSAAHVIVYSQFIGNEFAVSRK